MVAMTIDDVIVQLKTLRGIKPSHEKEKNDQ